MRRSLIIGVLVIIVAVLAWYFLLLSPTNERIAIAEQELETEQQTEVLLRTRLQRLKRVDENRIAYVSAIGQVETNIPPTPDLPTLIDDLKQLAQDNGIEWDSGAYGQPSAPSQPGQVSPYLTSTVTLQVKGQFFEVLGYLYGIEDMDRLIAINSVSFSPADQDGFTVLSVSISAEVYTTSPLVVPTFAEPAAPADTGPAVTTTTIPGGG